MTQTLSPAPIAPRDPFGVRARGSSPRVEILGGLSTFMAMSYIVLVNPAILAKGGIPWQSAFLGTLLVCCVAITPIAGWIPATAATGALLYVAVGLLPDRAELTRTDRLPLAVSAVMAIVTALTSALDQALLAGLVLYLAGGLTRGRRPGPVLLLITVLLGLSVALQYTTS